MSFWPPTQGGEWVDFFQLGSFCCILGEAGDVDRRNGGATVSRERCGRECAWERARPGRRQVMLPKTSARPNGNAA